MSKGLFKILIGIALLLVFIYTGIPFEFEDRIFDSILRMISFLLIFILIYFIFKEVKKVKTKGIRIIFYPVLGLFSVLFILGGSWNDVTRGNSHGNWFNLEICTNESGTTILRQMRETSGSIYDYRDRIVLYEFNSNNRISINTNASYYEGPWEVLDIRTGETEQLKQIK